MTTTATAPSVPYLDLTKEPKSVEAGTEEWKLKCQNVREALETYGFITVHYDKISNQLLQEMFQGIHSLFDLPWETKRKYEASSFAYVHVGDKESVSPYQSIGVLDAALPENAKAFTDLMWPLHGNDGFSHTMNSMAKKMVELGTILMNMINDSYGVGKGHKLQVEGRDVVFQMLRYATPMGDDTAFGIPQHIDANFLTILCQNEVDGLLIKSKEGEWLQVRPDNGTFVVFGGQALRGWSNGRLHAALHKVTISGDKERLSCSVFLSPKEDQIVEAPQEFVDKEHPPLFKPFTYSEFFKYYKAVDAIEDSLQTYAGI